MHEENNMEKIEIDKAVIELRNHRKFLEELEGKLKTTNNFPDDIKSNVLCCIFEAVCLLGDIAEILQLIELDDWKGWENRDKRATDDEVFAVAKVKGLLYRIFLDALRIQKILKAYPKDKIIDKKKADDACEVAERIKELTEKIDDPVGFSEEYR
jgi:hypothetical protein